MEIATQPSQSIISRPFPAPNPQNSMSHGFYGLSDGFDRSGEPGNSVVGPMVGDYPPMYDTGGPSGGSMLSDMFNFPQPAVVDMLQIPSTAYRLPPPAWPGKQESQSLPDPPAAMRLFLMSPQERGSTSPPWQQAHQDLQTNHPALIHSASFGSSTSYTGGGGGLSLSLSPNLQRLEMAKVEGELGVNNNSSSYYDPQVNVGGVVVNGQSGGVAQMLRQSKYATAARELLQEFCSVGKGQVKGGKRQRGGSSSSNPKPSSGHAGGRGGSCSDSKEGVAVLSPSDRFEQQRRKAKLLAMLDEVDRRYSHYCEQMQSVVTLFDSVMGFGAAAPYTTLAQKAMSRHFRCLKDAVAAQLKEMCEALGEKDCSVSLGITKGETPRLKLLDQSLRQQRAFHQMGTTETEAWRPQRGLPEKSVNILRSWLFEHFLHPYPSDSDKHLLARQTGLSRNQVSNWFINARVRLWKPMIEEMYQQEEAQDEEEKDMLRSEPSNRRSQSPTQMGATQIAPASHAQTLLVHRHQYQHQQQFSSSSSLDNQQFLSTYQPSGNSSNNEVSLVCLDLPGTAELCGFDMPPSDYGVGMVDHEAGRIRFGANGDVSLTLELRHTGNVPEASRFSVRDFGGL